MKTEIFFEIKHKNAINVIDGIYNFKTADQAIKAAKDFKSDPRSSNPKMSAENVKYWKNEVFTIVSKTVVTCEIASI